MDRSTMDLGVTAEELELFPMEVREKLREHATSREMQLRDLKREAEEFRVVSEQQCFELEKELQDTAAKFEKEKNKNELLESRMTTIENSLEESSKKCERVQNTNEEIKVQLDSFKTQASELAAEKSDLLHILDKKTVEIGNLTEELKTVSNQYTVANQAKCNAMIKLDELNSSESILKHQMKRLEQDKETLLRQVEHLNVQVSQLTHSLFTAKAEQSHKILDLELKLDQASEEMRLAKDVKDAMQKTTEEQNAKVESLLLQLKEQREFNIKVETQFNQELQSQSKLVKLYKEAMEGSEQRVEELLSVVEEMQGLLKEAAAENKQVQVSMELERQQLESEIQTRDQRIAKLEDELFKANQVLEQTRKRTLSEEEIENLSPSAAAASRMLKSGRTLTEIYSHYMEVTEQLQTEKETNAKLNMYLKQVFEEIEEKAPVLQRQREDYEKSIESLAVMTEQLNKAVIEHEQMQTSLNEANRKCRSLSAENDELRQSAVDLGRQICLLLKELEEANGREVVNDHDEDSNTVSSTVNSASNAVTANLVTFRNIEDLQCQNQKLLMVVRELSERHQSEETEGNNEKMVEMKSKLDGALNELAVMRDIREKQDKAVAHIVRQRDAYKTMLDQARQGKEVEASIILEPKVDASSPKVSQKEVETMSKALNQLQEEYTTFKAKSAENVKILEEEKEKLKEERMELRLRVANVSSRLEFATQRCNTLKDSCDGYKKELASLTTRNEQLSSLVARHEDTTNKLRTELMSNHEKLCQAQAKAESLRQEKILFQHAEGRYQSEMESLRRERINQAMVLSNLESIQNHLEKSSSDSKALLESRVLNLEKENSAIRNKLDRESDKFRNASEAWDSERQELLAKIQNEVERNSETREELVNSYSTVHSLRQELSVAEAKLQTLESMVAKSGTRPTTSALSPLLKETSGSKELNDLGLQLEEARAEVKSLREKLQQSTEHVMQYKFISGSLEARILESEQENAKLQETLAKSLNELRSVIESLEEELRVLKEENSKLTAEKQDLLNRNLSQLNETNKQLAKVNDELNVAFQTIDTCKVNEKEAVAQLAIQSKMAKESQECYERQLMLHSEDVKSLEELRVQVEEYKEKLSSALEDAKRSGIALKNGEESWKEREEFLKTQTARMEEKCSDLEKQNELLHAQFERVSNQIIALQVQSENASIAAADGSAEQSNENILEVIRYLRKEKDIATTKCKMIVAENERLNATVTHLEKVKKDTNAQLQALQQQDQGTKLSAAQHNELLRKVELLNVLTDSSSLLRQEKASLQKRLQEAEAKANQSEQDVTSVKEKNEELQLQIGAFQAERKVLESEARRWQSRAQHLVEQTNKSNQEEFKRALTEKEQLLKQVGASKEELLRARAEISSLDANLTTTRRELECVKTELQSKSKELANISEDLGAKDSQLADMNKTIQQVRKIGRKYKAQFDELKVMYDELKLRAEQATEGQSASEAAAVQTTTITPEAVEAAKEEGRQEIKQEMEERVKEAEENARSTEEKMKKLRQTAYQRITQLTTSKDDALKELQETKAKLSLLEQAKIEENQAQAANAQPQLEARISELETELTEAREAVKTSLKERQSSLKEVEELKAKLLLQQRHLESLQKQLKDAAKPSASVSSSRDTNILALPGPETGVPPTANIKPMATPSATVVRHPHPSGGPARSTPMGRIRPISTVHPAASRTAAVPPTTATVSPAPQDTLDVSSSTIPTSSVPQATVAPTPAVVIVPVVSSPSLHDNIPLQSGMVPHTCDSPSVDESTRCHLSSDDKKTDSRASESDLEDTRLTSGIEGVPHAEESIGVDNAIPSTSSDLKRTREEMEIDSSTEGFPDKPFKKRMLRDDDEEEDDENSNSALSTAHPVAQPQVLTTSSLVAVVTSMKEDAVDGKKLPTKSSQEDDDLEVILVESDDDAEENEGDDSAEDNLDVAEDDAGQGVSDNYEDDEEDEQMQDFQEENPEPIEEENFRDSDEEIGDDGEDVEIIELSGEQQHADNNQDNGSQRAETAEALASQSQSSHHMYLPRIPVRSDRVPSLNRQQPVSFSSIGSTTGFEDGDSIVPSTPTLFNPRVSDGFAEAVSSPHVPSERFLFGNTVETPSQLASQGALGMDDTKMDLTQFDEGSGRSVPSTPLQVSPLETPSTDIPLEASETQPTVQEHPDEGVASGSGTFQGTRNVPAITVTAEDSTTVTVQEFAPGDGDHPSVVIPFICESDSSRSYCKPSTSYEGPMIVEVTSLSAGDVTRDAESGDAASPAEQDSSGNTTSGSTETEGQQQQAQSAQVQQAPLRQSRPIVWDRPTPRGGGRGGSPSNRGGSPNSRGGSPNSRGGSPSNRGRSSSQPHHPNMGRPFVRRHRAMGAPAQQRMNFRYMNQGRMMSRRRPFPR